MKRHARLLSLLLPVILLAGSLSVPASAGPLSFPDVTEQDFCFAAVGYVTETGLMNGMGDGTFSPKAPMTRAMLLRMLANKAENFHEADYTGKSAFSDVDPDKWYAAPVQWGCELGFVSGVGNGRFAPNAAVTREEMAQVLYRYAANTGNDLSWDTGCLDGFPDGGETSSWARRAMKWAVTHFVFRGDGARLHPRRGLTRGEAAQVMWNARELLANNTTAPPNTGPPPEEPLFPDPPEDPTPKDLPEGALTYGEFQNMFPCMKKTAGNALLRYAVLGVSGEGIQALGAAGPELLRAYAITQIQTCYREYDDFQNQDIVRMDYSLAGAGKGRIAIRLWYFPGGEDGKHVISVNLWEDGA